MANRGMPMLLVKHAEEALKHAEAAGEESAYG